MSYTPFTNFLTTDEGVLTTDRSGVEVVRGNVPGTTFINKFGRNSAITTGSAPEDIWEGGDIYTGMPLHSAAAETVTIVSDDANDTSAGTGARTVTIIGLDGSWNQVTETLTMNGTTQVTSSNSYKRLNRAFVATAGTSEHNEGILTIAHSTTTANVFAAMPAEAGQTQICAYTIPDSVTGYLRAMRIFMGRSNGSAGSAQVALMTREEGGAWRKRRIYEITDSIGVATEYVFPTPLTGRTDIKIQVESVSDSTTIVTGDLAIELVDD